ncbi:hypothetical protein [Streptomyces sp. NPDC051546]|uniref:hypothetical protein n=1 Tax=Streptomyces sp. NPDC051546 TaxID=3365655 RepID=UPI0037AEB189
MVGTIRAAQLRIGGKPTVRHPRQRIRRPAGNARVVVVLPDGQELRALLYERRRGLEGWQYRVAIALWQAASGGRQEPVEHAVWLDAGHVRPIDGGDYGTVTESNREDLWIG